MRSASWSYPVLHKLKKHQRSNNAFPNLSSLSAVPLTNYLIIKESKTVFKDARTQGIIQTSAEGKTYAREPKNVFSAHSGLSTGASVNRKYHNMITFLVCMHRQDSETSKLEELPPLVCVTDISSQDNNESTPGEGLAPTPTAQLRISGLKPSMLTKIQMKSAGTIPHFMINFTDND